MKWYANTVHDILNHLGSQVDSGLSNRTVKQRLKQFGKNQLVEPKRQLGITLFFKQFKDFMVIVLLIATFIAAFLGEIVDAIVIIIIVLINSLLGFLQEQRAEKSLAKLKQMANPVANVLRDGQWVTIPSNEIVIGDIVRLKSGDRVVADMRIIKSVHLSIEESAITGETLPIAKTSEVISQQKLNIGDQKNMAFMSSLVTAGHGIGVVVATGMETVVGQIADLIVQAPKQKTPLEKRLQNLGKILIFVSIFLTSLVVAIGIWQGNPVYQMFLSGISLAVAVIPEGLPAIVTVVLSLGVQRMIKKKAIVRKLGAVETLGSTSVICSDKTGTLTENRMTVVELFLNQRKFEVSGGYQLSGLFTPAKNQTEAKMLERFLSYASICSDAELVEKPSDTIIEGDPTEVAIMMAAAKKDLNLIRNNHINRVLDFPFDSTRKRMSVVVKNNDQYLGIVKGAPDLLLKRANRIEENGQIIRLDHRRREKVRAEIDGMTKKAYRTIALCIKPLSNISHINVEQVEDDLIFMGLIGMIDPPRPEAKQAIEQCKSAGIKTIMITGDHAETARAIAQELKIIPPKGQLITGETLDQMSDEHLAQQVDDIYVFARVTPKDKLRIVQALQSNGHVVAMTGDGVNDAPALKASDIGISMGETGTDVAKEASDLILLDDNFATVVAAVEEGRQIYENIRKFIRYLLASNVGEILVMLFAMLAGYPLPLLPVQILWINLVTDGLPALALGMDQSERDLMEQAPRPLKEGIFARGLGYKILSRGFLIGIVSFLAFVIAYQNGAQSLTYARTIAFITLVMAQLIHVFDCRSHRSIFSRNPFGNRYLIVAVLSSFALLIPVIYIGKFQVIFYTVALTGRDWFTILLFSSLPTILFGFTNR
ncbi:cation-translocating P-type ATPase [Amphibacillus sp. MSJ-3]|uniref:cation-translocating P-type ATPase n=1 Tax=Amphibacillus sp. MSJ-3 TaxID=2841505 RepID=UPI001C0EE00F|nr:cation-translocating P-type ATPase [Amphibacillus sp. MSJ-3]MBU5594614.1 cation-translocating P-type ATPase [Amphibacillus sp. MSJ-3]